MRALSLLDHAQPPAPDAEAVASTARMTAEVAAGVDVIDKTARGEVGIFGADVINKRPEVTRVPGTVGPSREIGVGIGKGECGRKVNANQRPIGQVIEQPIQHILTRPDVPRTNENRRGGSARANG